MSLSLEDISCCFYTVTDNDILELEDVAEEIGFSTQIIPFAKNWKELRNMTCSAIIWGLPREPYFMVVEKITNWSMTLYDPQTREIKKIPRLLFYNYNAKGILLLYPKQ